MIDLSKYDLNDCFKDNGELVFEKLFYKMNGSLCSRRDFTGIDPGKLFERLVEKYPERMLMHNQTYHRKPSEMRVWQFSFLVNETLLVCAREI